MTVKLSDMTGSSSNDTTNNGGAGDDESESDDALIDAVESVGGDVDQVREYIDANGAKDKFMSYIESLDDDKIAQGEKYRRWNDQSRIRKNWLYNVDGSFSVWATSFYGDSSDPEPDTYNGVQQESRDEMGVNLMFHKALFPEPVEEHWPGEPVLYHEFAERGYGDGEQDTDIYVTQEFVEEYSDFTVEIGGEAKPRPPTDDEIDAMDNGGASASETTPVADDGYRSMDHDELKQEARDRGIADDVDLRSKNNIIEALVADDEAEGGSADESDGGTMTVTINGNEVTGDADFIKSLLN